MFDTSHQRLSSVPLLTSISEKSFANKVERAVLSSYFNQSHQSKEMHFFVREVDQTIYMTIQKEQIKKSKKTDKKKFSAVIVNIAPNDQSIKCIFESHFRRKHPHSREYVTERKINDAKKEFILRFHPSEEKMRDAIKQEEEVNDLEILKDSIHCNLF